MKLREALDLPDKGRYFHSTKQGMVENPPSHEKEVVEHLYPDLGPEAQRYVELITSDSYKQCVNKLSRYLGVSIDELHRKYPSFSSLFSEVLNAFMTTLQLEEHYTEELSILAVEVVLDLPEFKMIKDLVENGELVIDARIDTPDLSNAITEHELKAKSPDSLTTAEKDTEVLAKHFENVDPEVLAKRSFAKTLAQGNAVNKFYLFHLVEEKLNEINPQLLKNYGIVCAGTQLSYYGLPMMEMSRSMIDQGGVGSAEVADDHTIIARGKNFPILIHEIVKGIYNWLSYDIANQSELDTETVEKEVLELMSGPRLYDNFRQLIDVKHQHLIPLIIKDLLRHPAEVIRTINGGGGKAKALMDKLVKRAEEVYNQL